MADSRWDSRYREPGYAYGTEANGFLQEHSTALPAGGRILCLAEGEGRNGVFLARQGFRVTGVDSSLVGLDKAEQLAAAKAVAITTEIADLDGYEAPPGWFDGIVSIFCHLERAARIRLHARLADWLRPGGVLLLEAYTPEQMALGTGGPPKVEMMMTLAELQTELKGFTIDFGQELVREVHEGWLHTGAGAVVQVVARRT